MSKIELTEVSSGFELSKVNENFEKIEAALNEQVLFRDQEGNTDDNKMLESLDMNGKKIYNLPLPKSLLEPVRVKDLKDWNGATMSFDEWGMIDGDIDTQADLKAKLDSKQPTLVSGTNIKTINGTSVLGSGDITISADGRVNGGTSFPGITAITSLTPNARIELGNTVPNEWQFENSRMTVEFIIPANTFFASNPSAHLAVVLRANMATIGTAVKGNGILYGNVGFIDSGTTSPRVGLEYWDNGGGVQDNWVPAQALSEPLDQTKDHRFVIESSKGVDGCYARYRVYEWVPPGSPPATTNLWKLVRDTGDVFDPNPNMNPLNTGLVFGMVFTEPGAWSLPITGVRVTWSAMGAPVTDTTSEAAAAVITDIPNDLTFPNSTVIKLKQGVGANSVNKTTFEAAEANTSTVLTVAPAGSAGYSELRMQTANKSATNAYYQFSLGALAGQPGIIQTTGYGVAHPSIQLRVGNIGDSGSLVADFSPTSGMKIRTAVKGIGQVENLFPNMFNFGGANATSFLASTTLDWENLCTNGYIASFVGGSGATVTGGSLENAIRPLYCMLSKIIAELKTNRQIF